MHFAGEDLEWLAVEREMVALENEGMTLLRFSGKRCAECDYGGKGK